MGPLRRDRDATEPTHEPATDVPQEPSDAIDALFREHFDFTWRVVRALGCDLEACDDVVQETFLVVRRRWASFDRDRSVRVWIAGIARRVVGHHVRARDRSRRREAAWPEPEPAAGPEETLARLDAASAVARFLASLDAEKREVFVLMEIEELTGREVAAIVGVGAPTVYSRLREARRRFAAFVEAVSRGNGGTT